MSDVYPVVNGYLALSAPRYNATVTATPSFTGADDHGPPYSPPFELDITASPLSITLQNGASTVLAGISAVMPPIHHVQSAVWGFTDVTLQVRALLPTAPTPFVFDYLLSSLNALFGTSEAPDAILEVISGGFLHILVWRLQTDRAVFALSP
jgi:hypothetical protein